MYARIYDKKLNQYYKSIIYCGINQGYYRQYVVLNPYTQRFELVDYLDKSNDELKPLVEIIQGCHAYFGMYGAQEGDGTPSITNEEQIAQTVDAIMNMMQKL